MGFAWNLILFSFVREREGYKHHADCTVEDFKGLTINGHGSHLGHVTLVFCLHIFHMKLEAVSEMFELYDNIQLFVPRSEAYDPLGSKCFFISINTCVHFPIPSTFSPMKCHFPTFLHSYT